MYKNRLFKSLCCVFLLLSVSSLGVLVSETPREILDKARTLKDSAESRILLEKNLSSSADLRPYYVLELSRLCALSNLWDSSLSWSASQDLSSIPPAIADEVIYWYGQALLQNNQSEKAKSLYLKRIETGLVAEPLVYLAYFRIASSGAEKLTVSFDKAFPVLKNTDSDTFALSRYLGGLSSVRSGEWNFAVQSFSRFSPLYDSRFPDFAPWSHYYLAYSLYRLGRWDASIKEFTEYLDVWKNHAYSWQAATTATFAAIQAGTDALPFAERAVRLAPTNTDRAESVLLHSSLLIDKKRFAEAETLLIGVSDGSATNGRTSFSPRAQFMLADIASRQNNPVLAEQRWLALIEQFPDDSLAEEALYRCGEQWSIAGDWARSSAQFVRYRQSWKSGRFLPMVLWTGGYSFNKAGNADLAILWWQELVKKYPQSGEASRAYSALVGALRIKKEYNTALKTAEKYQSQFPLESKLDDIEREITELTKLSRGERADIAALKTAYIQAKSANTAQGRSIGINLARQYQLDYNNKDEAKVILQEITAKAPRSPDGLPASERKTYALAWNLLGTMYREEADFKAASFALLASGAFYSTLDGERAAEALFGAADSFIHAGYPADAKTTVATLEKNWPESVWTRRALVLMAESGGE